LLQYALINNNDLNAVGAAYCIAVLISTAGRPREMMRMIIAGRTYKEMNAMSLSVERRTGGDGRERVRSNC
jgi:hypothetical protein